MLLKHKSEIMLHDRLVESDFLINIMSVRPSVRPTTLMTNCSVLFSAGFYSEARIRDVDPGPWQYQSL